MHHKTPKQITKFQINKDHKDNLENEILTKWNSLNKCICMLKEAKVLNATQKSKLNLFSTKGRRIHQT